MRLSSILFVLGLLWAPFAVATSADTQVSPPQTEAEQHKAAMDKLAESGIRTALKAIYEHGSIYPFGLMQTGEKVQMVGYSGKPEDALPSKEWARQLFWRLRKLSREKPEVEVMALFKMHEIETDSGEMLPGLWGQVDHRDLQSWIIFVPFIKNESGKHERGELQYFSTEQPLFDQPPSDGL